VEVLRRGRPVDADTQGGITNTGNAHRV